MDSRFLKPMLARLRFAIANLAPLPLLALLFVAAAAYICFVLLPTSEAAIDQAEGRLAALERKMRRSVFENRKPAETPEETRQRLLARFPVVNGLTAELGRLVELAEKQGLRLEGGDYRLQPAGEGALFDRYVLNLPIKGEYRRIRTYLKQIRISFPELAIDDVALRRDNIGSAEVEVQLRVVLFARRSA